MKLPMSLVLPASTEVCLSQMSVCLTTLDGRIQTGSLLREAKLSASVDIAGRLDGLPAAPGSEEVGTTGYLQPGDLMEV